MPAKPGSLTGTTCYRPRTEGCRRHPYIRRDEGISEELKDIAEAFGLEIRDELLWPRANRCISGGFTVEENFGRPLPSAHHPTRDIAKTRWSMLSEQELV